MGVSTDGDISFGYAVEDAELPWDAEDFDHDIEEWWRSINNYKPPFEAYAPSGGYMPGFSKDDPRLDEYFNHRRDWFAANPLPVEILNYCSGECPLYAIVVPGSHLSCRRGYPKEFNPSSLVVTVEQVAALKQFCDTHGIEIDGEPKWLLTSYWG